MKKIRLALGLLIAISPYTAFAATAHNYVCSDFSHEIGGGATCSGDALTMPPGGSGSFAADYGVTSSDPPVVNLHTPTTWYVSFTYSGSGEGRVICVSYTGASSGGDFCISNPNSPNFTGSVSDKQLYTGAEIWANQGLYFRNDSSSGTFTLSNICISDTIGGCPASPPPPPPSTITGSGTTNRLAKFTASMTVGDSLLSDDGSNTILTSGNLFLQIGALIDTIATGILNIGTVNATSINIGGSGVTTTIPGTISWGKSTTVENCISSTAPSVCGSASAGSVALPTGTSTLVVNTTAVTANSQILITEDSSLKTRLGIACNTNTNRTYSISARTPGTSFTIKSSINPNTNKACLSYWIVN